jgi:Flp pilus assembly pilin Flp
LAREDGQNLVEHALIVTLIAVAGRIGSHKVAAAIGTTFTNISTSLS